MGKKKWTGVEKVFLAEERNIRVSVRWLEKSEEASVTCRGGTEKRNIPWIHRWSCEGEGQKELEGPYSGKEG